MLNFNVPKIQIYIVVFPYKNIIITLLHSGKYLNQFVYNHINVYSSPFVRVHILTPTL